LSENIEQGKRLDLVRKSLNISQVKFAKTIGITQGYLSQILLGKVGISSRVLKAMSLKYPNISTEWLLVGDGSMIKSTVESESQRQPLMPFSEDPQQTFLPANIALIRRRWQLGQDEFGALVSASRAQVSNWERGRTAPDMATLARLEVMAGLNLHELHTREVLPSEIPDAPLQGAAMPSSIQHMLQEVLQRLARIEQLLQDSNLNKRE
jgi:DNA-binding transcriptional regulator YiaG